MGYQYCLFFIGVGASINFQLIIENPLFIFIFGAVLTLIKFLVLFGIGKIYKKKTDQNLLFSLGLSQAGEFGFVILSFCMQLDIIPNILANQMMAVIAISMLATPFLLLFNDKFLYPIFQNLHLSFWPYREYCRLPEQTNLCRFFARNFWLLADR